MVLMGLQSVLQFFPRRRLPLKRFCPVPFVCGNFGGRRLKLGRTPPCSPFPLGISVLFAFFPFATSFLFLGTLLGKIPPLSLPQFPPHHPSLSFLLGLIQVPVVLTSYGLSVFLTHRISSQFFAFFCGVPQLPNPDPSLPPPPFSI